ncbi:MAG: bifunctional oligoribonuclease/PAP phosphatase NrnA [Acidimicrobiia bacterium]
MSDISADLEAVARLLGSANSIGVVGHVGPDGDALGSMIGLARSARLAGKQAVASFDEPFVVPEEMSFLDTSLLVAPSDFPLDLDIAVVVDTSVRSRVGALAGAIEKADHLVVIDHHISDGSWGDVVAIDAAYAATTEMVYELLNLLTWPIDKEVATALYTGLVTDTGRFQYSSTSSRTHTIASDLLARGVETDVIGQKLFEEASFGYYEVVSRVLGRAILEADLGFVWSIMELADLDAAGLEYHETDGLIDLVRMARGTEVACLLKRKQEGVVKGSLRSRGRVDVAAIARSFDGGGHHNAAGFTSSEEPGEIIEQIVAHLS